MKKILLLVITTMLLVSGCSDNKAVSNNPTTATESNTSAKGSIQEYFPFVENTYYEYEGDGNATQQYFTSYLKDNRIQRRITGVGLPYDYVLEIKDGKLSVVCAKENNALFQNFLEEPQERPYVILQEPLKQGQKWEIDETGSSEITNMKAEVEVPFGKFEAMEVTCVFTNGYTTKEYYAKDVGLVKSIFIKDGVEQSQSVLKNYSKDAKTDLTLQVFYSDEQATKLEPEDVTAQFKTNDDILKTFETILKTGKGGQGAGLISEGTKINKLETNEEEKLTKIDLSQNYIDEMNAGSSYEILLLQGLTNTLGYYANTPNVLITVDGKNYNSGHIEKADGEYFTVTPVE